ncbi:MAG: histidine--tRNA ligase [Oscillospiraceae bacterium]|jgi:histidyl-tRNA synthetase|nr:histidine--tRNA ligase [Oscillospiraceae bacterium]
MERTTPRTLSGFMELLPGKQAQFERVRALIESSFRLYGFAKLDTPIIESAEVLLAKAGGETEKQIYRFNKGEHDLALRFDLTVPLAKYVAAHYSSLSFPFRRCQIGKVYRGERAQRGRFREFYQADIDIIGDGALDVMNEAEIPAIICNTFRALGLKRFKIRVNNRKILSGFFGILGIAENVADVLRIVDKLDKIGAEKCLEALLELGLSEETSREILKFIASDGTVAEKLAALNKYRGKNETFDTGLDELKTVTEYLPSFGVPTTNFDVDLTIARGLDYYTGTVYETILTDYPEIGSVCSGGRYDDLAGYYTDKKLPGVGISIGLTRLFYVLDEQGLLNPALDTAPADVLVIPMTEDLRYAASVATALRSRGIRAQLYSEKKKFKAKMSYADKLGFPFAAIIGEDEIEKNVISLKDMKTGKQKTLSVEKAAEMLAEYKTAQMAVAPIGG